MKIDAATTLAKAINLKQMCRRDYGDHENLLAFDSLSECVALSHWVFAEDSEEAKILLLELKLGRAVGANESSRHLLALYVEQEYDCFGFSFLPALFHYSAGGQLPKVVAF